MTSDEQSSGPSENLALALIGLAAAALLIASPWLVDRSGPDPYYKGPLIYPQIVLAITMLASLGPALRFLRGRIAVKWQGMPARTVGLFLIMCLYPVAIGAIGLGLATCIAVSLGLRTAGKSWRLAAPLGIVTAAILWILFRGILDIWFPQPWLFELLGG